MKRFTTNKVVHATYSAGETFWNVTECKGNDGCVYIVMKHTNYFIPQIEAEFDTKKSAIRFAEDSYKTQYDVEKARTERMNEWKAC